MLRKSTCLILDSDRQLGAEWTGPLTQCGLDLVRTAPDALPHYDAGLLKLIVIASRREGDSTALAIALRLHSLYPDTPVLIAFPSQPAGIECACLRFSAKHSKPAAQGESIPQFLRQLILNEPPGVRITADSPDAVMIGDSAGMQRARSQLQRIGRTDVNLLISGESGAGKELAASLVHHTSQRRDGPFVCVNCAAIPDSLVESELFGFQKEGRARRSGVLHHCRHAGRAQERTTSPAADTRRPEAAAPSVSRLTPHRSVAAAHARLFTSHREGDSRTLSDRPDGESLWTPVHERRARRDGWNGCGFGSLFGCDGYPIGYPRQDFEA